jgi:O-succinylbenzoic acid--CoA ligase
MKPGSTLFDFPRFGPAPALFDQASRRLVRYHELDSFLESVPVETTPLVATRERPTFDHAARLLAALRRGCVVAPVSFRLPDAEARRRIESLEAFFETTPPAGAGTVLFTSGSSGEPRAVWHPLQAHVASARASSHTIPLNPGSSWLMSLPLHHVSGFSILIRCLLGGAQVVFPDSALRFERQVDDSAVTHLSVVSTQLSRLLDARIDLVRFHAVLGGGGPFAAGLANRAIEAGVPLHLTYGMTETASQITTTVRLERVAEPLHSGKPLRGLEVRISTYGEIQVRGPMVAAGFLRMDGRLENPLDAEGWFSTGDLGHLTALGNLVVTGRRDRLLISGGENIQPEPIEVLLMGIAGIRRAVVVPRWDARYGERPVAFVAGEFDPANLKIQLAAKLEPFAIPEDFLPWPQEISEDLPKPDFSLFKRLAVGL